MQFKELLSQLSAFSPIPFQLPSPQSEVLGVYILPRGLTPQDSSLLYFCTQAQLSQLRLPADFSGCFLIYGEDPSSLSDLISALPPGLNLALLPEQRNPNPAFECLSALFLQEQRLAAGMKVLLSALVENCGLQHLIDAAYTLLKNPIFVSDSSNKYLATVYDEETFDPEGSFARFILDDVLYNYVSDKGLDFIKRNKLDDILSKTSTPYCTVHPRFEKEAIFASIRAHNVIVGKIFMVAVEHPFSQLDHQLFSILVNLVNQELQKDDYIIRNRYERDALFLIDLITSSYADPEMLERSASAFKFDPNSLLMLAVTAQESRSSSCSAISVLSSQLKRLFPSCPVAIMDGHLVLLISLDDPQSYTAHVQKLEEFARRHNIQVGLCYPFPHLRYIQSRYQQAIQTITLGQSFLPEKAVYAFRDVMVLELLSGYRNHGKLSSLVLPEIFDLRDYDRKNGSEYLRTLESYLRHMGKSQRVCEELHIHKNTLLYRVGKLTEHFGLALDNGEAALKYGLSLQILQLLDGLHN